MTFMKTSLCLGLTPRFLGLGICLAVLTACSSSPKLKPASLSAIDERISLRTVWSQPSDPAPSLGSSASGQGAFSPAVSAGMAVVAGRSGELQAFSLGTGQRLWSLSLNEALAAGVGTGAASAEGHYAVVTRAGELVLVDAKGQVRWRQPMGGVSFERPAISSGVVAVRLADNRLVGFDQETGSRRWLLQRTLPSLVLHGESGLRVASSPAAAVLNEPLGPTDLLAGLPAGRLLWLNASNGAVRWESQVVVPRGSNEVERISDLLGAPVVLSDAVCFGAYQNAVGCRQAANGRSLWQKSFALALPIAANEDWLIAVDSSDRVSGFNRRTGERAWTNDALFLRQLSAPVLFADAAWLGDSEGYLHAMDLKTGALVGRLRLEAGRPSGPMVTTTEGLLVQTQAGRVSLLRQ